MNPLAAATLAVAALALAGVPAAAQDNTSWTFDVLEVTDRGDDAALVRLKPVPSGREFPRSCDELTIHSTFSPIGGTAPSGRRITRKDHRDAIRALLQAQMSNQILRVGSIDTGFGAIQDKPKCEVASRALVRLLEEDNVWAVYSFY